MTTVLEPRLTKLDERVLDELPTRPPGVRATQVTRRVLPSARGASLRDVQEILRGFEHLGRARQRNGWWTAA